MTNTIDKEVFDELRPYYDSEIPAAMRRIVDDPTLDAVVAYAFPDIPADKIRKVLLSIRTAVDFQFKFVKPLLGNIIKSTTSSFTANGGKYLRKDRGYLFISNHRDIVLDSALLQYFLTDENLDTSEITFGSNLLSSPFVEDFGRSNKMFKIFRGGSVRDLVRNSMILSQHLHDVVNNNHSIWISQRDGRTKDGNDRTDQGLLKMFTMAGGKDTTESLISLNIAPFAISYEYESCDALKTQELYISRREAYVKSPGEDMKSILTGIQQYKGEVHIEVCKPITPEEIHALEGESNNEILRSMAALIDRRIISAYKLYPNNYAAYDILNKTNRFTDKYTFGQKEEFIRYVREQIFRLEGDENELTDIMLSIYANPVNNKISLDS